jgi:hypothetical protein
MMLKQRRNTHSPTIANVRSSNFMIQSLIIL